MLWCLAIQPLSAALVGSRRERSLCQPACRRMPWTTFNRWPQRAWEGKLQCQWPITAILHVHGRQQQIRLPTRGSGQMNPSATRRAPRVDEGTNSNWMRRCASLTVIKRFGFPFGAFACATRRSATITWQCLARSRISGWRSGAACQIPFQRTKSCAECRRFDQATLARRRSWSAVAGWFR